MAQTLKQLRDQLSNLRGEIIDSLRKTVADKGQDGEPEGEAVSRIFDFVEHGHTPIITAENGVGQVSVHSIEATPDGILNILGAKECTDLQPSGSDESLAVEIEELGADELLALLDAVTNIDAHLADERYDSQGNALPFGRCDTCGNPCDANGCTADRSHKTAL